jgi:hypothetical protein
MTTLTVGAGQQFSTISAAVGAAQPGDTIQVQAGTYTNDFPNFINSLTIEGVGGQVNLVATQQPWNGKGIFDVGGNTTLKNISFSGAADGDGNGAGVRYEGGNLTIQDCIFANNQDGLLSNPDSNGTITIDSSEFYGNGTSAGNAHNMYIGNIKQFTITNSYIHDANTGHEIKSRAMNNTIENNRIFDNGGTSSYSIDLPDGGNAEVKGNVIEQGSNGGNPNIIAFGEEGSNQTVSGSPNPGNTLDLTNNAIINDLTAHTPQMVWNASGAAVTGSGNQIYGLNSNQLGSGVSGSAFTSLSSEPALNTSSPVTSVSSSSETSTPTPDTIVVNAAASTALGVGAHFNLIVDGTTIGSDTVGSATAQSFSFSAFLAPGASHDIGVQYDNDAATKTEDRNLYLKSITVDNQTVSATSSYEVYNSISRHGAIPSSGNMYWNGTADFTLPANFLSHN